AEYVVLDANQLHDDSTQAKDKALKQDWFKQPLRPPTPYPEWNKRQKEIVTPSKPLPLQGRPGHLTVVVDYFFNDDMEYLKSSDLERMYTTSIMKTKAARYEISVSVKKLHGYGHLEEIVVKRADQQLYKFKEGDFSGSILDAT
ncbi:hypothetical protein Tco_1181755, partial [Tanacetum coccineum]